MSATPPRTIGILSPARLASSKRDGLARLHYLSICTGVVDSAPEETLDTSHPIRSWSTFRNDTFPKALVEFLQLAIIERDQRFLALQDRWDGLGQAKGAIANGDYEAAMRIGVVCRRVHWIAASARGQKFRILATVHHQDFRISSAVNTGVFAHDPFLAQAAYCWQSFVTPPSLGRFGDLFSSQRRRGADGLLANGWIRTSYQARRQQTGKADVSV
jgi:hypothetical protein